MNKLFFNPKTKSIVLNRGKKYYDTRNGQIIELENSLPFLKLRANKEYKSKWFDKKENLETILAQMGAEDNRIPFRVYGKEVKYLTVNIDGEKVQVLGEFPYYFIKHFVKNYLS